MCVCVCVYIDIYKYLNIYTYIYVGPRQLSSIQGLNQSKDSKNGT